MIYDLNAKTQRRKDAKGIGPSSVWGDKQYESSMEPVFSPGFAPLRLGAFALKYFRVAKWTPYGLCIAVVAGAGCVSQKHERLEAQRAYAAGQEQGMQAAMRARQDQGPVVFVQGAVRNSAVPWEEGMKLSQAIVAADYTGFMNPRLIRVLRNGQVAGEFKGIDLLHHEDMELENGDMVLIVQ
jgi:hypothetical protein